MNLIINFIKENYRLIIDCCAVLVSLIFFLVKKKPNQIVDSVSEGILKFLPHAINIAELSQLKGEDKKKYCLDVLREWARRHSIDLTDYYIDFAKKQIELILTTPKKKEDK